MDIHVHIFIVLLITGLSTLAHAATDEELTSIMTINEPLALTKELNAVPLNMPTNFSEIPWGSRLSGFLRVPYPADACEYISTVIKDDDDVQQQSVILFVERGGCSFVTKAFFAQMQNVEMVLIVNNKVGQSFNDILVDDGSGREINIPVAMISQSDGDKLREYLESPDLELAYNIWVSINFRLDRTINNGGNTKLELWFSSGEKETYTFLQDFFPFYDETLHQEDPTSELFQLEPHAVVRYFAEEWETTFPDEDCLVGGRYCAPPPSSPPPYPPPRRP